MQYELTKQGFQCGSKRYIGECIDRDIFDIGKEKFDGKIYRYPSGKYQVVKASRPVFRVPIPGMIPHPPYQRFDDPECEPSGTRADNVARAQKRIYQIMLSNEWRYFLTCTFDDEKVDASNIPLVAAKAQKWLKNMTQRKNLGYVMIPEYHKKDNRVHFHAIINGDVDLEHHDIYAVQGVKKPMKLETIQRYHIDPARIRYPVYNCSNWKYGFSTAIEVYGSPARLANYVLKYMTKDHQSIFGKSYWCSKNIRLYPDIELYSLGWDEFAATPGKQYYHRGSDAAYKYINRLGDKIEDLTDDEVTISPKNIHKYQ